eukprot:1380829-Prymnesium_polylepis.1
MEELGAWPLPLPAQVVVRNRWGALAWRERGQVVRPLGGKRRREDPRRLRAVRRPPRGGAAACMARVCGCGDVAGGMPRGRARSARMAHCAAARDSLSRAGASR